MSESDITNCASAGARGLSVTVGGNSQNKRVEKEGWQIAFFAFFSFSTGSHYAAHGGLQLPICQPLPQECRDYRCGPHT